MPEPDLALIYSFYEAVQRKGPGSAESTLRALSMLGELPPKPRIIDFGCGSGLASLELAGSIECHVTAVDNHQPFLDELQSLAVREEWADRIEIVQADMADPPFPDSSFDLIWSEAAIYNVGFETGLKSWRRLLREGGRFAVSEVSWLKSSPPPEVAEFWQAEYPAITSIDANLNKVCSAGYEEVGHFVQPAQDWENYYGPLQENLTMFRSQHATNQEAQTFADSVQQEIDIWREFGECYGYVFYLGRVA